MRMCTSWAGIGNVGRMKCRGEVGVVEESEQWREVERWRGRGRGGVLGLGGVRSHSYSTDRAYSTASRPREHSSRPLGPGPGPAGRWALGCQGDMEHACATRPQPGPTTRPAWRTTISTLSSLRSLFVPSSYPIIQNTPSCRSTPYRTSNTRLDGRFWPAWRHH
ncbi:hypothetical protein BC567DRAFT_21805 [Phyllosticta citribraziliensis]